MTEVEQEVARLRARLAEAVDALQEMSDAGNDFCQWHPKFSNAIEKTRSVLAKVEKK